MLRQDLRQTISQRIDPKLIMANAILQQSSNELAQQIESELLENPALELIEQESACNGSCANPEACPQCSQRIRSLLNDNLPASDFDAEYEPVSSLTFGDDDYDPVSHIEAEVTLQDHLIAQVRAILSAEDVWIGEYIVHSLDDNGWLDASLEDLAYELDIPCGQVERVLKLVQTLDPPGVAARDLRECMTLQLAYLREEGAAHPIAERMIRDHFPEVVNGRYGPIARALGTNVEKVRLAAGFIRKYLNPYPAGQFRPPWEFRQSNNRSSVRPDVVIRRTPLGYEIEILGPSQTLLGVNPTWREEYEVIRRGNGHLKEDHRKQVAEYVERAETFIRHINQRRRTLRQITRSIIDCQHGFIETGSRAFLVPLTRTKVAEVLGMHESTVSRATAKKYIQLPNQEVVPFEIFFNPSLAIKTAIEEIIASEDPSKPLSDQRIVELLSKQGIDVARRTIVKYRDAQKILSSNRRRR